LQVRIYDEPWAPVPDYRTRTRSGRAVAAAASVGLAVFVVVGVFLAVRFVAEGSLGQCAPPWLTGTDPQLCLNASVSRDTLTVSGTASLPDGTVVTISAETGGTGLGQYRSTGTASAVVTDGAFSRSFDVSQWGAGTIVVSVEFAITPDQPQAVIDRYGWRGERLHGPDVEPNYTVSSVPPPMVVRSSIQVDLSAR
jgi:hypothetical protein